MNGLAILEGNDSKRAIAELRQYSPESNSSVGLSFHPNRLRKGTATDFGRKVRTLPEDDLKEVLGELDGQAGPVSCSHDEMCGG